MKEQKKKLIVADRIQSMLESTNEDFKKSIHLLEQKQHRDHLSKKKLNKPTQQPTKLLSLTRISGARTKLSFNANITNNTIPTTVDQSEGKGLITPYVLQDHKNDQELNDE